MSKDISANPAPSEDDNTRADRILSDPERRLSPEEMAWLKSYLGRSDPDPMRLLIEDARRAQHEKNEDARRARREKYEMAYGADWAVHERYDRLMEILKHNEKITAMKKEAKASMKAAERMVQKIQEDKEDLSKQVSDMQQADDEAAKEMGGTTAKPANETPQAPAASEQGAYELLRQVPEEWRDVPALTAGQEKNLDLLVQRELVKRRQPCSLLEDKGEGSLFPLMSMLTGKQIFVELTYTGRDGFENALAKGLSEVYKRDSHAYRLHKCFRGEWCLSDVGKEVLFLERLDGLSDFSQATGWDCEHLEKLIKQPSSDAELREPHVCELRKRVAEKYRKFMAGQVVGFKVHPPVLTRDVASVIKEGFQGLAEKDSGVGKTSEEKPPATASGEDDKVFKELIRKNLEAGGDEAIIERNENEYLSRPLSPTDAVNPIVLKRRALIRQTLGSRKIRKAREYGMNFELAKKANKAALDAETYERERAQEDQRLAQQAKEEATLDYVEREREKWFDAIGEAPPQCTSKFGDCDARVSWWARKAAEAGINQDRIAEAKKKLDQKGLMLWVEPLPYEDEIIGALVRLRKQAASAALGAGKTGEGKMPPAKPIEELLRIKDESQTFERKASTFYDYKKDCRNDDLKNEIVKAVAGLINKDGGTLLIGVRDDGTVLGLEKDYECLKGKKGRDGYQLQINQLLLNELGNHATAYFEVKIAQHEGKDICVIRVRRADTCVWIQNKTILPVRTGNMTKLLRDKDAADYVADRLHGG